jgi:TolA-binding protein
LNASESAPTPNTASSDEADEEYGAAVAMYGAGKFAAAAEAFHGLGIRHPDAPTAEDAMFLEALSLSREGMAEQAARVAARHAARFPQSVHRKDAALLVARAARSRGDCEAARRALAPWLATQDESARRELAGCVQ